jgi:hypothetical protein
VSPVSYPARVRFRALATACLVTLAGCGGSDSGGLEGPEIGKAKSFELADFKPAGPVRPGEPATVSFHITQPDGKPLTRFKKGDGPHTGVHLIFVKKDLSDMIHLHPPLNADGSVNEKVTFPSAGPWRTLVDVYPDLGESTLQNFQLTDDIDVKGDYKAQSLPATKADQTVDGDQFALDLPKKLESLKPESFDIKVKDQNGKPADFGTWFGATAHAIFFKDKTLDYFHTHVCRPEAKACQAATAGNTVVGKSTKPGELSVGTLLPSAGKWKLFLQTKVNGDVVTVPYTLDVG